MPPSFTDSMLNFTTEEPYLCDDFNTTNNGTDSTSVDGRSVLVIVIYSFICVSGLVGNGLVIYVILRYAKMKTVTNMYILNLAISDFLFLLDLPLVSVTAWLKHWVFGEAMCKINFILYSITIFTSVFTLMTLSIDRYFAVCHPLTTQNYRQPVRALMVILVIWTVSFMVMLPIILYSQTVVPNQMYPERRRCTIVWPDNQPIPNDKAYTWYTFLLGFAIPVSLITVFYTMVVLRLRTVGPANRQRSTERKKSHRKVTRMVLAVISVYIICWLPHWIFQINLTFQTRVPSGFILLFNIITFFSYANSMLNPILYAFLSENFRKSFKQAFVCCNVINNNESGVFGHQHGRENGKLDQSRNELKTKDTMELHSLVQKTADTVVLNNGRTELELHSVVTDIYPVNHEDNNVTKNTVYRMESVDTPLSRNDDEEQLIVYADKEIQTK